LLTQTNNRLYDKRMNAAAQKLREALVIPRAGDGLSLSSRADNATLHIPHCEGYQFKPTVTEESWAL
jgi:hypothetical protein